MANPDSFRATWHEERVVPSVAAKPLTTTARRSSVETAAATEESYRRTFVNDERNSRLAVSLPKGEWEISGMAKLENATRPQQLLLTDKRLALQGEGPWHLYDHDLSRLAFGYRTGGGVTLDAEHNLLFFPDTAGLLKACQLGDGKPAFSVPLTMGEAFEPDFVVRRGQYLLVKSSEQMLDLHTTPPETSSLEVIDLGKPLQQDTEGFLLSALSVADLLYDSLRFFPAMVKDSLVVASEARIYAMDLNLNIHTVLEVDIVPDAMSLDELGRIYLVGHHDKKFVLWLLNLEGERYFEVNLPADLIPCMAPPLVTHSHEVILLSQSRVFKFAQDGQPLWEYKPQGSMVGGVLTADDSLLLTAGTELFAFSSEGRGQLLYSFKEPIKTPPALATDGTIFVATETSLYRLETWQAE